MMWKDLRAVLNADDKELFDKIFENGQFTFDEPIFVDQLDMYDESDAKELEEEDIRFGCKIEKDNVIVPAGLPFIIKRSTDPYVEFTISRNGIDIEIQCPEDELEINVVLTKFGDKLVRFKEMTGYSDLLMAYSYLVETEKIFGVNLTNQ